MAHVGSAAGRLIRFKLQVSVALAIADIVSLKRFDAAVLGVAMWSGHRNGGQLSNGCGGG